MPGDTKIKRTTNGWIDVDEPAATHPTRWKARAARRFRLKGYDANTINVALNPLPQSDLTSLQRRLFNRMTVIQGIPDDEALTVIRCNTYNKAASYGHMRLAGANPFEAQVVIDLGIPAISRTYGLARAAGKNHTEALQEALLDTGWIDDGDD